MHENMLFVYINWIVKPRSTSGSLSSVINTAQISQYSFAGCIDGDGPYGGPLTAPSVLLSLVYIHTFPIM